MLDIDKEFLEPKRSLATTNEEMFMLLALSASSNSKDPSTQVGACCVSEDGKVLSIGRNCVPPLWDEDEFPWGTKKEYGIKNNKYPYIIHAEMDGTTNYKGSLSDFKNGTLYVTLFPCTNCSKLIASLGIKRLVYLNARKDCEDFICSSILLNRSNIECVDFRELYENPIEKVELDMNADEKGNVKIMRYGKPLRIA